MEDSSIVLQQIQLCRKGTLAVNVYHAGPDGLRWQGFFKFRLDGSSRVNGVCRCLATQDGDANLSIGAHDLEVSHNSHHLALRPDRKSWVCSISKDSVPEHQTVDVILAEE